MGFKALGTRGVQHIRDHASERPPVAAVLLESWAVTGRDDLKQQGQAAGGTRASDSATWAAL